MKLADKRFWDSCKRAVNKLFLWLFITLAVLLVVDLWGLLLSAIYYIIVGGGKSVLLLKAFGAVGVVLVLFFKCGIMASNVFIKDIQPLYFNSLE